MARQHVHVGSCLPLGDAGLESRHDPQDECNRVLERLAIDPRDRQPDVVRLTRRYAKELAGSDANDRVGPAADTEVPAQDSGVAAKSALPEPIADDRAVRAHEISLVESSPEHWHNTKYFKVA